MHTRLAAECGIPDDRVQLATNGDILELTKETFKKVDRIQECRVLVEGRDGNDITRVLVKDRRKLAEMGVMFSLLVRNSEDGKLISGPDILGFGLVNDAAMPDLQEECKLIVKRVIDRFGGDEFNPGSKDDLQEEIRIELRRHLKAVTGKKPVVLPIVLDL
jgi:ribonuclease J